MIKGIVYLTVQMASELLKYISGPAKLLLIIFPWLGVEKIPKGKSLASIHTHTHLHACTHKLLRVDSNDTHVIYPADPWSVC